MNEKKLFAYKELQAICLMCVAEAGITITLADSGAITSATKARERIENKIDEIIDIRWNHESKK